MTIAVGPASYLNLREQDEPATFHGYDHFGVLVGSEAELRELWDELDRDHPDVTLRAISEGGSTLTFRMQHLLPWRSRSSSSVEPAPARSAPGSGRFPIGTCHRDRGPRHPTLPTRSTPWATSAGVDRSVMASMSGQSLSSSVALGLADGQVLGEAPEGPARRRARALRPRRVAGDGRTGRTATALRPTTTGSALGRAGTSARPPRRPARRAAGGGRADRPPTTAPPGDHPGRHRHPHRADVRARRRRSCGRR